MTWTRVSRAVTKSLLTAWLVCAWPHASVAGTTGKIAGRIVDAKKQPVVGVNVAVPLARAGAITDQDGRFVVVNVPAGTYEVKLNLLGYRAMTVRDVIVSADQTTALDAALEEAPVAMEEIVVSAQRPVVDVKLTSTLAALSREEIRDLPVQELQDIVNLQAGVVDGHFRGGRKGEVQFQVDGVTVNNAYDNTSTLSLDRSLLEEVQVISGTFDAEYGQAMSGVVNAVLRRGTEKFQWDGEAMTGGFAYAAGPRRRLTRDFRPMGTQNYQLTMSGPTIAPNTFFLLSGRRYSFDDYLVGRNYYTPWIPDVPDSLAALIPAPVWKVFHIDGDAEREPVGYRREWSGVAKLTNRSIPSVELNYQAVFNDIRRRDTNWQFRLNPDGLSRKRTFSVSHGLDATATLSKTAFYTLSLRHNYFDYRDMRFDDVYDGRYDSAGATVGFPNYEYGAIVEGVQFNRFTQNTSSIIVKSTLTNQWSNDQQFKVGTEFEWPQIKFGQPGFLQSNLVGGEVERFVDLPPFYPAVSKYRPYSASGFVHSETEWNDLTLRAGMRLDYFNPRSILPSDLSNPANAITGAPPSKSVPTHRKVSLSPRLALSFPITRDAALFFAYGHFTQLPELGKIFTNADYALLRDLQASTTDFSDIMGNPDIEPEKTVQYQFGYRQAATEWLGVEANVFYKDIRDLLGIEFVSTYNDAEYARWTNVDFGNVWGVTVSLDQRRQGIFSSALDYTWQRAQGNSSDPRETATRADAGEDPRPRVVPFNWDQRHTLNLTITASEPNLFTVTSVVRVASGQPYTPEIETGFGASLEANSGRKPGGVVVDLRGDRQLEFGGLPMSFFGRVFNAFDTRFFNGSVYATSGSPYYSRFAETDRNALADPTRFYAPRRIEVGLTMSLSR